MSPPPDSDGALPDGIEYLDPQAQPGAPPRPYKARLQPDKKPPVIGLLSNLFADASAFLNDLREPLAALLPGATFRFYDKGTVQRMSFPVADEVCKDIMAQCDAVVCAYGHCGSCTSGTTQDALAFAAADFPTLALVTEKFRDEAFFLARAGGFPELPFVFLPHPVAGKTAQYHRALAEIIAPAVVAALVEGRVSDMAAHRPEELH
ncbi:MAG: UGSC family (seleno)protein [Porticoccaceae bacterium]